jgi:hypothetical protein
MAKLKFDVSHVEDQDSIPLVKPNVIYKLKIEEVDDRRPGKEGMMVRARITSGKFKGTPIWSWVGTAESSEWRLKQFVKAVTDGKDKMNMDPVGKIVAALVNHRPYEGEDRNNIKSWMPLSALDEDAVPEDDDIPDEEDDDDEDADVDEDDEDEDDEDDEDDDEDEDEEEEDPLDNLTRAGLKTYIKDNNLDVSVKKSMDDDAIRDAIRAAEQDDDDEEEEEEDEDEDFNSMDEDELREECESRGLKSTGSKKQMVARLEKDAAKSGAPF